MLKGVNKETLKKMQENLATFRRMLGYSPEEFGAFIDLTRQSITNIETGKTGFTSLHFRAITQVIGEICFGEYIEKISRGEIDEKASGGKYLIVLIAVSLLTDPDNDTDYEKLKKCFEQLSQLMYDNDLDDPVAVLKGLIYCSYDLKADEKVPYDKEIDAINEAMEKYVKEMAKKTHEIMEAIAEGEG